MICMETIAKIRRLYHKESLSIRAIALKLNINRRTVKKHIEQTQIPVYQKPAKRYPMLGDFLPQLDQRLSDAQTQYIHFSVLLLPLRCFFYPKARDTDHNYFHLVNSDRPNNFRTYPLNGINCLVIYVSHSR